MQPGRVEHVLLGGDADGDLAQGVAGEALDGELRQIVWIEPQDARAVDANGQPLAAGSTTQPSGFSFPTSFGNAG
ncbi:hypothetical protein [Pseudomonas aeruginosa]